MKFGKHLGRLYSLCCQRQIVVVCHQNISTTSSACDLDHKVIVSKSHDIFTNLALEEWIYETKDLSNQSYLLMWRNKPAIVIGRHQNPWLECDVNKLLMDRVSLARRKSGGGCVYHDLGNLNCSFIKHKKRYNRKENLDLIVDAITGKWDIDLSVNIREDIVLDNLYKVSGTASKLGRNQTYHHCTLLCDVNKENLATYLNSPMATVGVHSRATQSQKSWVQNLAEATADMNFHSLVNVIGRQFQNKSQSDIQWVDPDEDKFPGLADLRRALMQWDWIYGSTPKFSICRNFNIDLSGNHELIINTDIVKGRIQKMDLICNSASDMNSVLNIIQDKLVGKRLFSADILDGMKDIDFVCCDMKDSGLPVYTWIFTCLKETFCI